MSFELFHNYVARLGRWKSAFIVLSVGAACVAWFLAAKLTPWFYAINTRVRLYMDAPAETKIDICWDRSRTQCLPLVPFSSANSRLATPGEVAEIWMSELPPRPTYFISLGFKSGVQRAVFRELELDSSNVRLMAYGHQNGAGVSNTQAGLDQFESRGGQSDLVGGLNYFRGDAHSLLILNRPIYSGPSGYSRSWGTGVLIWSLLFSAYLLVTIPLYFLPRGLPDPRSAPRSPNAYNQPWWLWVLCGSAMLAMILLVADSGVLMHQYDPLSYLQLATGQGWFNPSRLPGYPLFLGLALRISGYSLNGVILLQATVLGVSVLACLWGLRKWLHPYAATLFVLLCIFSPAQITNARWILRESVFTSLVLVGMAAAISYCTAQQEFSQLWMMVFALVCGLAFLVRENGVILTLALLPVLTLAIIRRVLAPGTPWERVRGGLLSFARYLLVPMLIVGAVYVGFSAYNYFHYGDFHLEEEQQTSHGFLAAAESPGNFDARGLLEPVASVSEESRGYFGWPLYTAYVLARDQHAGDEQTYTAFYPSINEQMSAHGEPASKFNMLHQASILNEIGRNVVSFVPLRAAFAGVLREYALLLLSEGTAFQAQADDPSSLAANEQLLSSLPITLTIGPPQAWLGPDNILIKYYRATQAYSWYEPLFILALLSSIYILREEDAAFLAPMAVYLANWGLILYSHTVELRFVANMDVLLVLQVALGFSCWIHRRSAATPGKRPLYAQ